MPNQECVKDILQKLLPLFAESRSAVVTKQDGVPTFFNVVLRTVIEKLNSIAPDALWRADVEPYFHPIIEALCSTANRQKQGRLVDWMDRKSEVQSGRDVNDQVLAFSQGVLECVNWKGEPVFKTAYEYSIYSMMIWELKPATIIELGSGRGGSAIWFSDMLSQYKNPAHVYSIDICHPDKEYSGVTFIKQDILRIDDWIHLFASYPKPWLVIEDAHVNIPGVLESMHKLMQPEDYLVVEDSSAKQSDIDDFMQKYDDSYKVDTRYIDFFGLNVTSAMNSVFKRVRLIDDNTAVPLTETKKA